LRKQIEQARPTQLNRSGLGRVPSRGLQHGQSVEIRRSIWLIPNPKCRFWVEEPLLLPKKAIFPIGNARSSGKNPLSSPESSFWGWKSGFPGGKAVPRREQVVVQRWKTAIPDKKGLFRREQPPWIARGTFFAMGRHFFAWKEGFLAWKDVFSLETAVEEGYKARKWPSHQGKEALWDEF
jgi:hypothetical protein